MNYYAGKEMADSFVRSARTPFRQRKTFPKTSMGSHLPRALGASPRPWFTLPCPRSFSTRSTLKSGARALKGSIS